MKVLTKCSKLSGKTVHMLREQIRNRRKEMGLTQEQVAKRSGISRQKYNLFENASESVKLCDLDRILDVLDVVVVLESRIDNEAKKALKIDFGFLARFIQVLNSLTKDPLSGKFPSGGHGVSPFANEEEVRTKQQENILNLLKMPSLEAKPRFVLDEAHEAWQERRRESENQQNPQKEAHGDPENNI